MRLLLAFRVFFSILFGTPLPEPLAEELGLGKKTEALPAGQDAAAAKREVEEIRRELEAEKKKEAEAREQARLAEQKAAEHKTEKAQKVEAEVKAKPAPAGPSPEAIAVRAISVFQAEGRLFDFLFEDIDGYSDAEVGAAVREIHRGCRRALNDHFKVSPVRSEEEESLVTVPDGYDPSEIRLVGNVVGRPPFSGTLKHRGWRVEEVRLPNIPEGKGAKVVVPAEVEV